METISIFHNCSFYSLFLQIFVVEIFKFKYDKFFIRKILLPFPNSNDLNSRGQYVFTVLILSPKNMLAIEQGSSQKGKKNLHFARIQK